jgi:hypothetical protein
VQAYYTPPLAGFTSGEASDCDLGGHYQLAGHANAPPSSTVAPGGRAGAPTLGVPAPQGNSNGLAPSLLTGSEADDDKDTAASCPSWGGFAKPPGGPFSCKGQPVPSAGSGASSSRVAASPLLPSPAVMQLRQMDVAAFTPGPEAAAFAHALSTGAIPLPRKPAPVASGSYAAVSGGGDSSSAASGLPVTINHSMGSGVTSSRHAMAHSAATHGNGAGNPASSAASVASSGPLSVGNVDGSSYRLPTRGSGQGPASWAGAQEAPLQRHPIAPDLWSGGCEGAGDRRAMGKASSVGARRAVGQEGEGGDRPGLGLGPAPVSRGGGSVSSGPSMAWPAVATERSFKDDVAAGNGSGRDQ